jgi:hypothetical protein
MSKEVAIIKQIKCPLCGVPMKKVKWELTNGIESYNVYLEVERTILRCPDDKATITADIPTGNKSDYAPS